MPDSMMHVNNIIKWLAAAFLILSVTAFIVVSLLESPLMFLLNAIAIFVYITMINFNLAYGTSKSMLDASKHRSVDRSVGGIFYWLFVKLSILGRALRSLIVRISDIGLRNHKFPELLRDILEITLISITISLLTEAQINGTLIIESLVSTLIHPISITTAGAGIIGNTYSSATDLLSGFKDHINLVTDVMASCRTCGCEFFVTALHILITILLLLVLYTLTYTTVFGLLYGTLLPLRVPQDDATDEDKLARRFQSLKDDLVTAATSPLESFSSIYVTFLQHKRTLLIVVLLSLFTSSFVVASGSDVSANIFSLVSPISDIIAVLINFAISMATAFLLLFTTDSVVRHLPEVIREHVYALSKNLRTSSNNILSGRVNESSVRYTGNPTGDDYQSSPVKNSRVFGKRYPSEEPQEGVIDYEFLRDAQHWKPSLYDKRKYRYSEVTWREHIRLWNESHPEDIYVEEYDDGRKHYSD